MEKIRAVIIDDEEAAIVSIKLILKDFCQSVEVVGSAQTPKEGIQIIYQTNPNLVFLDIDMPQMNGFEMLKSIPDRSFEVIFITAYNQYALDAFKVNAVDYILKPISIPDLINSISRFQKRFASASYTIEDHSKLLNTVAPKFKKVAISSLDGIDYVDPEEIVYLEAEGAYTQIVTVDAKFTTPKTLKDFSEFSALASFFRIHNSFLVNLKHVKKYNRRDALVTLSNSHQVSVSRRNKEAFLKAMEQFTN